MGECFGKIFILNGEIVSAEAFSNSFIYEGESVYEVIRMKNGLPVFLDDHYERIERSAKGLGKTLPADFKDIKSAMLNLSTNEPVDEVNLKIVFNYNKNSEHWLLYYTEPSYPSRTDYTDGVKAILFHAERHNPASKVINHRLRSEIYHRLILESAYEALLVNSENCITEGSRSNIFFIRNDVLYTAPEGKVLEGITRKYILDICREKRIAIVFRCVNISELSDFESVFMTGTSPVVLPFAKVGDIRFEVNNHIIRLLFNGVIEKAEASRARFASG